MSFSDTNWIVPLVVEEKIVEAQRIGKSFRGKEYNKEDWTLSV
jgi:hypothetical protein